MEKANSSGSSTADSNPSAAYLSLEPPRPYTCTLCFRSFLSSQALGGHQNAHRKEKREAKRLYIEKRLSFTKNSAASSQPPLSRVDRFAANPAFSPVATLARPCPYKPERRYGPPYALWLPSKMPENRCLSVGNTAANQDTGPSYSFVGLSKRGSASDTNEAEGAKEEGGLDLTLKL